MLYLSMQPAPPAPPQKKKKKKSKKKEKNYFVVATSEKLAVKVGPCLIIWVLYAIH